MSASGKSAPGATPTLAQLQQAAQWYAMLQSGDAPEVQRRQWQAWLAADAMHKRAWDYVERVGMRLSPVSQSPDGALAVNALMRVRSRQQGRRQLLLGGLAAAGLMGVGGWQLMQNPYGRSWVLALGADYRAGIGDIRQLALPGGGQMWLDTGSAVNLSNDAAAVDVHLRTGALLLDTVDRSVAVSVQASSWQLLAAQARFQVRSLDGQLRVGVQQGQVELVDTRDGHRRALEAGMQLLCAADGTQTRQALPVGSDAWTRGMLYAQDLPLGELIAEFRRYRVGVLRCDPSVAHLRVLGTFPLLRLDDALDMLAQALPVRVNRRLPGWIDITART